MIYMNIQKILIEYTTKLKQAKIPTPRIDAEFLLSHVFKKPREYLFTYPNHELSKSVVARYALCIIRRTKGEPIAYITGHKGFYGLDFFVNKNVLIPRPETELMVDEIMKHITHNMKHIIVVDVGTGSGCIIISLIKELTKSKFHPAIFCGIKFLATDISKPALTIARKNAKLHHVNKQIKFLNGNLLEPIINKSKILNLKSEIIITANLPYLTPAQIKKSASIQREPKLALAAGADGLKYYRELFKQIKLFKIYSLRFKILVEINPCQTIKIKWLIKREFPHAKIQIKKDLRGLNRLVIISTRL